MDVASARVDVSGGLEHSDDAAAAHEPLDQRVKAMLLSWM